MSHLNTQNPDTNEDRRSSPQDPNSTAVVSGSELQSAQDEVTVRDSAIHTEDVLEEPTETPKEESTPQPNLRAKKPSLAFSTIIPNSPVGVTNNAPNEFNITEDASGPGADVPTNFTTALHAHRPARGTSGAWSVYSAATVDVVDTAYVNMLIAQTHIHWIYDALAVTATWLLLAGFIILPGTFDRFAGVIDQTDRIQDEALRRALKGLVSHIPFFAVAAVLSGTGLLMMFMLWWRWHNNYYWLVRKIFMPGFLNGLAGLLTTLVNVFAINKGPLKGFSLAVLIVVSSVTGVSLVLTLFYEYWLLRRVIKKHEKEVGVHSTGKRGEGRLKYLSSEVSAA